MDGSNDAVDLKIAAASRRIVCAESIQDQRYNAFLTQLRVNFKTPVTFNQFVFTAVLNGGKIFHFPGSGFGQVGQIN